MQTALMRTEATGWLACNVGSRRQLRPHALHPVPGCLSSVRVSRQQLAPVLARPQSRQVTVAVHATVKSPSTVKIVIQGRKLQVTEAIKAYVEKKISHAVAKYAHTLREVDIKLSARGGDTGSHGKREQKVEVTIFTLRNGVVRVEDSEESLYASIDVVCDKIQRKLTKIKELAVVKGTWPGKSGARHDTEAEDFQEYMQEVAFETKVYEAEEALNAQFAVLNSAPTTVLRSKTVSLDPMTVDEAIEAMEMVGHGFYVFRERTTDQIQVVYRRSETAAGKPTYGVLLPKKSS